MDFFKIREREGGTQKKPVLEIYPEFQNIRSKDLMIRAKSFYAIWNPETGLWSTDEYDVQRLVDKDLREYETTTTGYLEVKKKYLVNFSNSTWLQFRNWLAHLSDSYHQLDEKLTFANTEVKKEDYVSRRLSYNLEAGDISAWEELVSTLYSPEDRAKIEWAIGAIVSGDSKTIQKFLVFYGPGGTGKSTIINIIQWLFEEYVATFEASAITNSNNQFSTEAFRGNPLVAIEHDGDLSNIKDNSKLNAIVAHEDMTMNEKFKPSYQARVNAFLIMGTNKPVKITDAKSGIIRRLIDVQPTGKTLSAHRYATLMSQIRFELGAIAYHCLQTYLEMGKSYYSNYVATEMMLQTDIFFNYIEAYYDIFKAQDGVTLVQAYELYKQFCSDSGVEYQMPKYKLRDELRNYFEEFHDRFDMPDGSRVRSWYAGFNAERFKKRESNETPFSLVLDETESLFDREFADCPAQYAKEDGTPALYWDASERTRYNEKSGETETFIPEQKAVVSTTLSSLDTTREHYVKPPVTHIVIDFDLTDIEGNKSAERNLEEASKWPPTYAEFSKSGNGVHLHYNWTGGDPTELSRVFDEGIEVKVFTGNTSLRRKLSRCNSVPVANLSSGLPIKEKKVINTKTIENEKHLRALIEKGLRKEVHPESTKQNMDYIHHILEEAYTSDMPYDVSDLYQKLMTFAMKSTNQSLACLKLLQTMKLKSEDLDAPLDQDIPSDDRLVFFDTEVFPNLFVLSWKYEDDDQITSLINPSSQTIERFLSMKIVGYNCRRYDNHILYGALMGLNNLELYKLSQKIIANVPNSGFGEAYTLSYTDIYDYASIKQSLKKWEIQLGIPHKELGLPWDQPVPKEKIPLVVAYCENDVMATEAVHKARKGDYIARQILADLSGLSMNHSTQAHTAKIVFGEDRQPQKKFKYTHLDTIFPGYKFDHGKSTYRGEITGEGGYVYAEPGMYSNVALLDIASMHPTSIEALEAFGEYTKNFSDLKKARIAIKHRDFDAAKEMLGGKLARHLNDPENAKALSEALKIAINIVYGLTSASFDNSFKDPRNIDNIVAKRGALFMIELKHAVQEQGFTVAHIKTDSIKIPNATPEIIQFVFDFGKKYGYDFEHEATYEKMCLVNEAVYIAKYADEYIPDEAPHGWTATGKQFAEPYVFKTLFSHEPIVFRDKCEEKHVTTSLWLDFEKEEDIPMAFSDTEKNEAKVFIGKAGLFCPIKKESGGAILLREKDGKFSAATGSKGYFWLEADTVKELKKEKDIDLGYFTKLVDVAKDTISKYGDFEWFIS